MTEMATFIICFLLAATLIIYIAGWWGVAGVALFLLYVWAYGVNKANKKEDSLSFFWWKK